MSQNQGDVQLKNECEKKKVKSTVTWHRIECDGSVKKKKAIGRCRCTISPGLGRAEGLVIFVLNQKQMPRDRRGQPNWLKWRWRWLNVMVCNKVESFFIFDMACNLNKVVYWINLNKVTYWINSNKVAQVDKINSKNTQFYLFDFGIYITFSLNIYMWYHHDVGFKLYSWKFAQNV